MHGQKALLIFLRLSFLPALFAFAEQDNSAGINPGDSADAEKLFDNSCIHRIDVRQADADWAGLLADPISKTKYAADTVIDGGTFSSITFSTKGFFPLSITWLMGRMRGINGISPRDGFTSPGIKTWGVRRHHRPLLRRRHHHQ